MEAADVHTALRELERRGLVASSDGDCWLLTDRGREEAERR
jgi:Mn-dependent DtxR family transcriptional regulator